eukprot:4377142-Amphidinium_carterae.1
MWGCSGAHPTNLVLGPFPIAAELVRATPISATRVRMTRCLFSHRAAALLLVVSAGDLGAVVALKREEWAQEVQKVLYLVICGHMVEKRKPKARTALPPKHPRCHQVPGKFRLEPKWLRIACVCVCV